MGLFGPPDVEKMKAKKDVKGLIKALDYQKDSKIRLNAAFALGQIGDARAVESLIITLKDNDSDVCTAAVSALGMISDSRAVESLLIVALRRDWLVGEAAVLALGQIGGTRAVEALLIIAVKEVILEKQATQTLIQIGLPAIDRLSIALKDKDANVRLVATKVLGEIDNTRAVEPLIAALKDTDWAVRKAAAQSLGKICEARAVEPLIAALKDTNKEVRRVVTYALVHSIGTARAVEPLIAALKDTDEEVRQIAALSLGQIGDARAVEPLIVALKDTDNEVRRAAAQSLGQIGDARAVKPLIAALKDKDSNLLWAELQGKQKSVRLLAAKALSRIGAPVVEALIVALKDKDPGVRVLATRTLGEIGDARAVQPLVSALMDEKEVREIIADALDTFGWQPGQTAEGAAYWIARGEWGRCVQIGSPAVEPLIAALKDENANVRCAAAESLVSLYNSAQITPGQKQHILKLRKEIINTGTHGDRWEHSDTCGFGLGPNEHYDRGVKVDFPL